MMATTFYEDSMERKRRMLPMSLGMASPDGVLTQNVQPGSALPMTAQKYRETALRLQKEAADAENEQPDLTAAQEYLRKRTEGGDMAMLNALAAELAGESFAPMQAQFLKRATAARDPMKLGSGFLTPEGQFVRDTSVEAERRAASKARQAQAYEQMATGLETAEQRRQDALTQQAYRRQQDTYMNELRDFMAQTGRMNALTAQTTAGLAAGLGGLGIGQATQIGSGANNEPIFRQPNGRLFTYDKSGQAIAYSGPVNPKASSAQPSEDERKSAGYALRIQQGLNTINDVVKQNPAVAKQGVVQYGIARVPLIGEMASNLLTPGDRQRVEAAQLDMLDAALTLNTGAAYTKEQLQGLSKSYFPQVGDMPQTIKDKEKRLNDLIETARTRASRALPGGAPTSGKFIDFNDLPKG